MTDSCTTFVAVLAFLFVGTTSIALAFAWALTRAGGRKRPSASAGRRVKRLTR